MKKMLAVLLAMALLLFGCGVSGDKGADAPEKGEEYADAVSVLNEIWDNTPQEQRFSAFGGSQDAPVADAPGAVDPADGDMLVHTLLIPEDIRENVADAASLVHMMNANTFTGAAVRLKEADPETEAEGLRDHILKHQFMCGFPERLVIFTAGDYLVYAFGGEENITNFKTAILDHVEGANLVTDQPLE